MNGVQGEGQHVAMAGETINDARLKPLMIGRS